MEFVTSILLPLVIGAVFGGIVGFFIARNRNNGADAKAQLEKLQMEMDDYRSSVRSHYVDTVALLSQIDRRQKELHRVVAEGVIDLCDSDETDGSYLLEQSVAALRQPEATDKDDRNA